MRERPRFPLSFLMTDLIAEAEGLLLPWEKTFYDSIWPVRTGARGKSLKSKVKATFVLTRKDFGWRDLFLEEERLLFMSCEPRLFERGESNVLVFSFHAYGQQIPCKFVQTKNHLATA